MHYGCCGNTSQYKTASSLPLESMNAMDTLAVTMTTMWDTGYPTVMFATNLISTISATLLQAGSAFLDSYFMNKTTMEAPVTDTSAFDTVIIYKIACILLFITIVKITYILCATALSIPFSIVKCMFDTIWLVCRTFYYLLKLVYVLLHFLFSLCLRTRSSMTK